MAEDNTVQNSSQSQQPVNDGWSDEKYTAISSKYQNNPKEVAKALWSSQQEATKIIQSKQALEKELETFRSQKKSDTAGQASQSSNDNQSSSKNNNQTNQTQTQNEEAAQGATESLNHLQLTENLYREVFTTGKASAETIQAFIAAGYSPADAQLQVKAQEFAVKERMNEAQSYVKTPIKDIYEWSQKEGNLTDLELAHYQDALDKGMYGVLVDLEKKMKSGQKVTVAHGKVSTKTQTSDRYESFKDYDTARKDARYQWDPVYTADVDRKYENSDRASWTNGNNMFGGSKNNYKIRTENR